jgi:hypothetical protein
MKHANCHECLQEGSAFKQKSTPWLKQNYDNNLTPKWSDFTVVIQCAARRACNVESSTILQTDYDHSDDYNDNNDYEDHETRSEHNDYGQSQFAYYVKDFWLQ